MLKSVIKDVFSKMVNIVSKIKNKILSCLLKIICVYRIKESKSVYLTFDDGPEPGITEFVLDNLKNYHIKATFFCLGDNIERNRDLFDQIVREGHSIGSHTISHLKGDEVSIKAYCNEVKSFIEKYHYKLFRPPHGVLTLIQLIKVSFLVGKSHIIMWTVDSTDWYHKPASDFDLISITNRIKPGSIILLHCCKKHEERTRIILPLLLEDLSNKNFTFDKL